MALQARKLGQFTENPLARKANKTVAKQATKKVAKKPARKPAKRPAKKAGKDATPKVAKQVAAKRPAPKVASKATRNTAAPQADTKGTGKSQPAARLFGTDGVRDVAGRGSLTPENILALGRALGRHLADTSLEDRRPQVLVGVDPRPSADLVGTTLAAGLVAENCDVHWPGMMSTPEVAFLTGHGPFAAGVSITASHNPSIDNGIKMFGSDGRKLPENIERKLERQVASGEASGPAHPRGMRFGWLQLGRERNYEDFIVKTFRKSFVSLKKRRISVVFDMAYGARSIDLQVLSLLAHSLAFGKTVPEYRVGSALQAGGEAANNALDIFFMNAASPSQPETHHLINVECGSLHPQGCARAVRELGADLGVCFDGDGDRCLLIDETGAVRDGDFILALLAADMKARGMLKNNTVVTTTMANLGLEHALHQAGIQLVRTDVGDRNVSDAMAKHGAVLGGEQSGHVILTDEGHVAGDGLYTALRVIEVMLDGTASLSKLCGVMRKYPQTIVNVPATRKPALDTLAALSAQLAKAEAEIAGKGRVNVRYSGTEPLLRIMVEAQDDATVKRVSKALAAAAAKDLG